MSVHCRKRALKQRNSRPQPPQRAFAALARSLVAAAFVASFTVQALAQMSGGGHADHHPGTAAPANPMTPSGTPPAGGPGTQPSMGSGAGGMGAAGGMGEMMKGGEMGEMMGRPRKEFYPSLMDMPTLSAEQRQCIEAQARARISKGTDEIQSAQDALRHANAAGDTASAEQAASRLRDGLDQVKSSTTTPETPTELREEQSRLGTLRSAYDRTTITGVIDRLVQKGLAERRPSSRDRRARELEITDEGRRTLRKITPAVESAQRIMLRGLSAKEGEELMRLLRKAIAAGNELSRAPQRDAQV